MHDHLELTFLPSRHWSIRIFVPDLGPILIDPKSAEHGLVVHLVVGVYGRVGDRQRQRAPAAGIFALC